MDKQFIINAISNLIEAEREWKRLCDIVFQLGGELEKTRFEEVMYTHEELVYKLLMEQSEFGEVNEAEFYLFIESIKELANNSHITVQLSKNPNDPSYIISTPSELYELYVPGPAIQPILDYIED